MMKYAVALNYSDLRTSAVWNFQSDQLPEDVQGRPKHAAADSDFYVTSN